MAATPAFIKGEGWKPSDNENCFNETHPIQEASYKN
ncbi:hypothetical protein SLEP1_g51929 [Rubroshorea leprosula]|uniref:Uncharacterized protein n=1 Tax=Rubroshorea leprosula TaxID=152421 RepID=A0AAV5M5K5_9ROSI|nr:hypothetical protein SLEP1_g51929 [Rubroshorea leprosula]